MKNETLKMVISSLPEIKAITNYLNTPSRKSIDSDMSMSIESFLKNHWTSPDECAKYLQKCTLEDLFCISSVFRLMLASATIFDYDIEENNEIIVYMEPYKSLILAIPYHPSMVQFIDTYKDALIKPSFTLQQLVKALM